MRMIVAALLQCIFISYGLMAQQPFAPTQQGSWKDSDMQLSDSQISEIDQILLKYLRTQSAFTIRLGNLQSAYSNLMLQEAINEQDISKQSSLVTEAIVALLNERYAFELAIRKHCTKEQWTKLLPRIEKVIPPGSLPSGQLKPSDSLPSLLHTDHAKPPKIINQPLPPYTPEARANKIEGKVVLIATIQKDGTIAVSKVEKGLGYGLDESAVRTVETQWRFEPGTLNGKPVEVRTKIEIGFRLPN
jgi:TonB family protein